MFATLAQYSALRESLVAITSVGFIGGAGNYQRILLLCVEHCFRFSYLKALIYFIPGIEGGQGNNDAIYGSHDDHDTFGVLGEGWQGPGNGEDILDLYNPGT